VAEGKRSATPITGWRSKRRVTDQALARRIANPRRGVINPIPGLTWDAYMRVRKEMFAFVGLQDYDQVLSGEMAWRPTPHLSYRTSKQRGLADLCRKWVPRLLQRVKAVIKPPTQTFKKESRTGWPHFDHPEKKKERVLSELDRVLREGDRYFEGAFIIANIRLQPEPLTKQRLMQFIKADGSVAELTVSADTRSLAPKWEGFFAERTRLVFNQPEPNLGLQLVDTAINNVYGSWPVCGWDMYGKNWKGKIRPYTMAVDVSHMERLTAVVIPIRNELIAGPYGRIHSRMALCPHLVKATDGRTFWLLGDPGEEWLLQFGSGHSAVAPSQKECVLSVLVELHVEVWGLSEEEALDAVIQGESAYLQMMNFGDDNFWSAYDPKYLKQAFEFCSKYLDVQEEFPKKFLGFVFINGEFYLPIENYVLKSYLHERSAVGRFRKFPYLGWREKRRVYREFAEPGVCERVFRKEDELLAREGLPWSLIEERAKEEELAAGTGTLSANILLGRDYLMTDEEKMESGAFDGMYPEETAPLFDQLTKGGILNP
jgi:hypothetical protein